MQRKIATLHFIICRHSVSFTGLKEVKQPYNKNFFNSGIIVQKDAQVLSIDLIYTRGG